jgi:hypothetical protein
LKHENKQMRLELQRMKMITGSDIDSASMIGVPAAGPMEINSPQGSIIETKPASSEQNSAYPNHHPAKANSNSIRKYPMDSKRDEEDEYEPNPPSFMT